MKENATYIYRAAILCLLALLVTPYKAGAIDVSFRGQLANFDGTISSLWSRIAVDKERTEVVTLNPRMRDIRIFNRAGMEIYDFGDNLQVAGASDIELDEQGNIYLVYPRAPEHKLLRLDYKGEPLEYIDLKDFPADFQSFSPVLIQYMDGKLYMADTENLDVVVTDVKGVFQKGYHFKPDLQKLVQETSRDSRLAALSKKGPRPDEFIDMFGFCADRQGNIYFTVPTLFSAFKYTVDGELRSFGIAGSSRGKFGVVAGINTDRNGNIYVTDRLRSVVMIFDSNFNLLTEFGYRGRRPGNLIVPDDLVIDDENGFIYVAQAANRGVSVFRFKRD